MKLTQFVSLAVCGLLAAPYALAAVQSASPLEALMSGEMAPLSLSPGEIGPSFKAMRISYEGGGGADQMFGMYSPFFLMGMAGGGMGSSEMGALALFSTMDVVWTEGKEVELGDELFLVGYKHNFDFLSLAQAESPEKAFAQMKLGLVLIKTSEITAITPMPNAKPNPFETLMQMGGGMAQPATMDSAEPAYESPGHMVETAAADLAAQSTNNLKQIALATIMYSNDYDDQIPYAQSTATAAAITYPYIKNAQVWAHPAGGRYLFNTSIGGLTICQFENPARVALLFEEGAWPDGTRVVAFVDGHVERLDEGRWAEIVAQNRVFRSMKRKGTKPIADAPYRDMGQSIMRGESPLRYEP